MPVPGFAVAAPPPPAPTSTPAPEMAARITATVQIVEDEGLRAALAALGHAVHGSAVPIPGPRVRSLAPGPGRA
jgi:hypothetical protein